MLKYVLLTIAAIGFIATAAQAGSNCQTTCQKGYGGQSTCNTHCY